MVSSPDNGVLERAVHGNHEALAQLLERYGPQTRLALEGRIPRRWQAVLSVDDVLQETYIDAFLDIGRFEPRGDGSFVSWLTTLAKRNLMDALRMLEAEKRGKKRRTVALRSPEASLAALYSQLGATKATPSRQVARDEAGICLQRAIAKLPETYRKIVEMYDLGQQNVDVVAAAVERSPGAVFMLRSRAHRQLNDLLGNASRFLSGTS